MNLDSEKYIVTTWAVTPLHTSSSQVPFDKLSKEASQAFFAVSATAPPIFKAGSSDSLIAWHRVFSLKSAKMRFEKTKFFLRIRIQLDELIPNVGKFFKIF